MESTLNSLFWVSVPPSHSLGTSAAPGTWPTVADEHLCDATAEMGLVLCHICCQIKTLQTNPALTTLNVGHLLFRKLQ